MQRLRDRCRAARSVFYAFPLVGTSNELASASLLLHNTTFLDVSMLPTSIPPPTKRNGQIRKNHCHEVDVAAGLIVVKSEPIEVRGIVGSALIEMLSETTTDEGQTASVELFGGFRAFWEFRQLLSRQAVAGIIR